MKTTVCLNALERATIEPAGDGVAITFSGLLTIRRLIHYKDAAFLAFLVSEARLGIPHQLEVLLSGNEAIRAEPTPAGVLLTINTRTMVLTRKLTRDAAQALAFALDAAMEAVETAAERAQIQRVA